MFLSTLFLLRFMLLYSYQPLINPYQPIFTHFKLLSTCINLFNWHQPFFSTHTNLFSTHINLFQPETTQANLFQTTSALNHLISTRFHTFQTNLLHPIPFSQAQSTFFSSLINLFLKPNQPFSQATPNFSSSLINHHVPTLFNPAGLPQVRQRKRERPMVLRKLRTVGRGHGFLRLGVRPHVHPALLLGPPGWTPPDPGLLLHRLLHVPRGRQDGSRVPLWDYFRLLAQGGRGWACGRVGVGVGVGVNHPENYENRLSFVSYCYQTVNKESD